MRLLYRADGGHPIGTGHLFRAARVIAQLKRLTAVEAHLVTADDPVVDRIVSDPTITVHRLPPRADLSAVKPLFSFPSVADQLERLDYDLIAIDMLDTPEADMRSLANSGIPVVTFDDRGEGRRYASCLINILIEEPDPASLPSTLRLAQDGAYVVLDPIFAGEHHRALVRDFGPLKRIFVAMGGADAAGLTVKVARALRSLPDIEFVELVCGPAFPHRVELEATLQDAPWKSKIAAGYPSLIPPFRACDLAVVAGGLTMYEVCCLGTPSLAVCQPIDHQQELAERLSHAGAMATVGYGLDASVEAIAQAIRDLAGDIARRRNMSVVGPTIVDGRGTARVADLLREAAGLEP